MHDFSLDFGQHLDQVLVTKNLGQKLSVRPILQRVEKIFIIEKLSRYTPKSMQIWFCTNKARNIFENLSKKTNVDFAILLA